MIDDDIGLVIMLAAFAVPTYVALILRHYLRKRGYERK